MLGQFEQQPLYNAMNFSRSIYSGANSTVYATGLTSLWCPSDGQIVGKRTSFGAVLSTTPNLTVAYTSYSCCAGTWYPESARLQLARASVIYPAPADIAARIHGRSRNSMNGVFRYSSRRPIAAITDGTSNTLLYSERPTASSPAVGRRSASTGGATASPATRSSRRCIRSTRTGRSRTSRMNTTDRLGRGRIELPPRRRQLRLRGRLGPLPQGLDQHLAVQPGHGIPARRDPTMSIYTMAPGTQIGVYQKLSTRAGGEVISSDQY